MTILNFSVLAALCLSSIVSAIPVNTAPVYKPTLIHQFPNNTWIENMAIRKNGDILATDLDQGRLFLVNPSNARNQPSVLLAHFDNHTALSGITEVEDDIFYIQGINNTNVSTFDFPPNSSSVYRVDMRHYAHTGHAEISKVADAPQIWLPNGMTTLNPTTILIADSYNGVVFSLNVHTGAYTVAIDHPLLKNIPGSQVPFGVNGITVRGDTLYFSSYNQAILGTFPIDPVTGHAIGAPHVIAENVTFVDDFAVAEDGSVWATENVAVKLVHVFVDGKIEFVQGFEGATALNEPVSARFGRTERDCSVLYVSTDGLVYGEDGSVLSNAGRIVAIDTAR